MALPPLKTAISDTYPNPSNATARTGFGALYDYVTSLMHGQCRLVKSGANLVLQRYNGQWLRINDTAYSIPSGGVSLAATSLSVGTTYNIYAYMSGATMTLEASTTVHATDSTTGVEVKSGDATRTLVGKARVVTGPAWVDTDAQRFVIGWFNRQDIYAVNQLSSPVAYGGTSMIELTSSNRAEFVCWDEPVFLSSNLIVVPSAAGVVASSCVAYDGIVNTSVLWNTQGAAASNFGAGPSARFYLTEGYHYGTLAGTNSAAISTTWGQTSQITVHLRG